MCSTGTEKRVHVWWCLGVKITHPSLDNHSTHDRYGYLKGPPPVFVVTTPRSKSSVNRYCKKHVNYTTSYGKKVSCVDPYPEPTKNGTHVRVAIGYGENKKELAMFLGRIVDLWWIYVGKYRLFRVVLTTFALLTTRKRFIQRL